MTTCAVLATQTNQRIQRRCSEHPSDVTFQLIRRSKPQRYVRLYMRIRGLNPRWLKRSSTKPVKRYRVTYNTPTSTVRRRQDDSTLWGIKIAPFLLLQKLGKIMPYYDNFWHIRLQENIPSPACLIVFVKSKTENQLIRFVIAYIVADNNVKCETVAATRANQIWFDPRLHHSRPMAS